VGELLEGSDELPRLQSQECVPLGVLGQCLVRPVLRQYVLRLLGLQHNHLHPCHQLIVLADECQQCLQHPFRELGLCYWLRQRSLQNMHWYVGIYM